MPGETEDIDIGKNDEESSQRQLDLPHEGRKDSPMWIRGPNDALLLAGTVNLPRFFCLRLIGGHGSGSFSTSCLLAN